MNATQQQIYDFMKANPTVITIAAIVERTGINLKTARNNLAIMANDGLLEQSKMGKIVSYRVKPDKSVPPKKTEVKTETKIETKTETKKPSVVNSILEIIKDSENPLTVKEIHMILKVRFPEQTEQRLKKNIYHSLHTKRLIEIEEKRQIKVKITKENNTKYYSL